MYLFSISILRTIIILLREKFDLSFVLFNQYKTNKRENGEFLRL